MPLIQLAAVSPGLRGPLSLSFEQHSDLNLGGPWISLSEANCSPRKMWVPWWASGWVKEREWKGQGRVWKEALPSAPSPRAARAHVDIIAPGTAFVASKYQVQPKPGSEVAEGGQGQQAGPTRGPGAFQEKGR